MENETYFYHKDFVKDGKPYRFIEYQDSIIWEKSILRIDNNVLYTIYLPFWQATKDKPMILFRGKGEDKAHNIGYLGGDMESVDERVIMSQIWYYDE